MKPSFRLLLVPLLVSTCQAQERFNTSPVAGWPGLHWGMTPTEVQEAFEGKAELIPKDEIQYIIDGPPVLVRIDKLTINGVSYRVRFAFDAIPFTHWSNRTTTPNGLCRFRMITYPKRTDVHGPTTKIIQPSLEEQFGLPIGEESMGQFQDHYSVDWSLPSTYVHLEVDIPKAETKNSPVIGVSYSATRPSVE